jgi:hypothetical protein
VRSKEATPLVALALAIALTVVGTGTTARAQSDPAAPPAEATPAQVNATLQGSPPPEASLLPEAPEEAPPPPPRHKGIVLDSSLGALGFLGEFRKVAPTAPWLHTSLGYELFQWLLLFGEADLAFTDTSVAQDPSKSRAFPIFGFGGGGRLTVHVTERVAVFGQGSFGLMKADVANNAFRVLGYKNAESLGLYAGGRLGVEWYQVDRHLALGFAIGVKDATNFGRTIGSDTPLLWDAGISLRYTFPVGKN